ncbi:MAG: DUF885 domain-containing protein, partial [Gemmatimonadales bacterium]
GFAGPRNGRLTDLRPAAYAAWNDTLRTLLRTTATLSTAGLDHRGKITLGMLRESLERDLTVDVCHAELWTVDQLNGPQVAYADLAALQPAATVEERRLLMQRWREIPFAIQQQVVNLRDGAARGYLSPRINVERVIGQLERLVAAPAGTSPLVPPSARGPTTRWARDMRSVVANEIVPAFRAYLSFLKAEYLAQARTTPGVSANRDGAACYRAQIRAQTTLDLTADSIHSIGEHEVDSLRQQMVVVARRRFGTGNLDSLLLTLRNDPLMAFQTRDEVFQAAKGAVERMEAHLPALFGRLPTRRVVVEPMPAYQEQDAPSAYYYPATADNGRPGRYLVNTYDPTHRPRYTVEALAFHEAVPGHHLQISLGQELDLPEFMRYGAGATSFVEGWALYSEVLGEDAAVYSDDLQRLGMLFFQSWRACRLVVDTGIHALGWSREQAIDYMLRNTGLSRSDVENEVDRYIIWPGQALAYKVGQREILSLRSDARAALGPRFDLRAFHDAVLADGAVSLPILRETMAHWIAAQTTRP